MHRDGPSRAESVSDRKEQVPREEGQGAGWLEAESTFFVRWCSAARGELCWRSGGAVWFLRASGEGIHSATGILCLSQGVLRCCCSP